MSHAEMTGEPVPASLHAAVMALSDSQRSSLARDLLLSLEPEGAKVDEGYDEAWEAELERRFRSIEDGTARLIPADEVFARIHADLRERDLRR